MADEDDEEKGPEAPQGTTTAPVPYSIFTSHQKALIVTIVSLAATFSAFASNIYFPAIPAIARSLHVAPELINLTITSYMILQGLSPSIWGAIADVHGRRITYIGTFLVFLGACIGLAETKHYYQLVILRCLQSAGSASTIAIGAGVIGDITMREERGGYMGIYQAGLLGPLAIGPILGGIFSQTLGWRAIFWFLTIYGGIFLIFLVLFLPETLRSMVGNGSHPAKGLSKSPFSSWHQRRLNRNRSLDTDNPVLVRSVTTSSIGKKLSVDFLGPIHIIGSIEVIFLILFLAVYYTVWQMTVTVMSTLFSEIYGLADIEIGLTFIGNGAGCIIGTFSTGKILDYHYQIFKQTYTGTPDDFPLEKVRLKTVWLWSALEIACTIVFGWTLDYHVHISVPIICTFILGWSSTSIIGIISTFLIDVYPTKGASATAALNMARCLMGAGGSAAVLPIVNAIGVGWTFTVLVGLMLVSIGLLIIQMEMGLKWRQRRMKRELDMVAH